MKAKSPISFTQRYSLDKAVRLSLSKFKDQGWLTNVPLYATSMLPEIVLDNALAQRG